MTVCLAALSTASPAHRGTSSSSCVTSSLDVIFKYHAGCRKSTCSDEAVPFHIIRSSMEKGDQIALHLFSENMPKSLPFDVQPK
jgi:hypothetical protein